MNDPTTPTTPPPATTATTPAMPRRFAEITKVLPHRYPFLLVDRVVESVPGKSVKA